MALTTRVNGVLEIDHERGVIYFHVSSAANVKKYRAVTVLRICQLPKPIPTNTTLDVTHMHGVDWGVAIEKGDMYEATDEELDEVHS